MHVAALEREFELKTLAVAVAARKEDIERKRLRREHARAEASKSSSSNDGSAGPLAKRPAHGSDAGASQSVNASVAPSQATSVVAAHEKALSESHVPSLVGSQADPLRASFPVDLPTLNVTSAV